MALFCIDFDQPLILNLLEYSNLLAIALLISVVYTFGKVSPVPNKWEGVIARYYVARLRQDLHSFSWD